jgi:hypothetical protein
LEKVPEDGSGSKITPPFSRMKGGVGDEENSAGFYASKIENCEFK